MFEQQNPNEKATKGFRNLGKTFSALAITLVAVVAVCASGTSAAAATAGEQIVDEPGADCTILNDNTRTLKVKFPYVRASGEWHYAMWFAEAIDANGAPIAGQGWKYGGQGWVYGGDNNYRIIGSYPGHQDVQPVLWFDIAPGPAAYGLIAVRWWEVTTAGQWTDLGYQFSLVKQYNKLGYYNGIVNRVDSAC